VDQNLFESVWQNVTSNLGVAESNTRHHTLTLETATNTIVDSLRFAPAFANTNVTVRFVTSEATGALLHNLDLFASNENHLGRICKLNKLEYLQSKKRRFTKMRIKSKIF
jgi:hypothetical protein